MSVSCAFASRTLVRRSDRSHHLGRRCRAGHCSSARCVLLNFGPQRCSETSSAIVRMRSEGWSARMGVGSVSQRCTRPSPRPCPPSSTQLLVGARDGDRGYARAPSSTSKVGHQAVVVRGAQGAPPRSARRHGPGCRRPPGTALPDRGSSRLCRSRRAPVRNAARSSSTPRRGRPERSAGVDHGHARHRSRRGQGAAALRPRGPRPPRTSGRNVRSGRG